MPSDASRPQRISRRRFMRWMVGAVVAGGAAAAGASYYVSGVEPDWLVVERVTVCVPGLHPDLEGLTLVQLTDLHLGSLVPVSQIREAVAITNDLAPDLVALTGDYVADDIAVLDDLTGALAGLRASLGVYCCPGNHDLWLDRRAVAAALNRAGLTLLTNQGRMAGQGEVPLFVAGLDDAWSGEPDLGVALAERPPEIPVLLLMHEPDVVARWADDERILLQLSGHSHGGQVRLPWRGAPLLPYLGQRYDQGLYRPDRCWLYTSRGIGVSGIPVRLNCRPEVTHITLTRA